MIQAVDRKRVGGRLWGGRGLSLRGGTEAVVLFFNSFIGDRGRVEGRSDPRGREVDRTVSLMYSSFILSLSAP